MSFRTSNLSSDGRHEAGEREKLLIKEAVVSIEDVLAQILLKGGSNRIVRSASLAMSRYCVPLQLHRHGEVGMSLGGGVDTEIAYHGRELDIVILR
jgi:hypothetical protein